MNTQFLGIINETLSSNLNYHQIIKTKQKQKKPKKAELDEL
jgi:hypothetical protein